MNVVFRQIFLVSPPLLPSMEAFSKENFSILTHFVLAPMMLRRTPLGAHRFSPVIIVSRLTVCIVADR